MVVCNTILSSAQQQRINSCWWKQDCQGSGSGTSRRLPTSPSSPMIRPHVTLITNTTTTDHRGGSRSIIDQSIILHYNNTSHHGGGGGDFFFFSHISTPFRQLSYPGEQKTSVEGDLNLSKRRSRGKYATYRA